MFSIALSIAVASTNIAYAAAACQMCSDYGGGSIIVVGRGTIPGNPGGPGDGPIDEAAPIENLPYNYFATPACFENDPITGENGVLCSYALTSCPQGEGFIRYWFWRQPLLPDGQADGPWEQYAEQCLAEAPVADEPLSEVTPDMVLAAFRELPLPAATARVQPEGPTLVNVETIFYTDAAEQTFDITLLGQPVAVSATPVEYTWHTGDGTTLGPTTSPGAPYPDHDVAHVYLDSEPYQASVDVTYGGAFSVDGGPTVAIPGTVTIPGPEVAVEVLEAHAQLVADP
jgi:hypothetical protein